MTIASAALSAITARPPAAGSVKDFQPQNLKRPVVEDLAAAIAAVATGDYEHVRKLYPRPLSVVGDCSRSMIVAGARARADRRRTSAASKAGCWPGLPAKNGSSTAYRRFDATRDPRDEPYCATACKIFARAAGHLHEGQPGAQRRQNL